MRWWFPLVWLAGCVADPVVQRADLASSDLSIELDAAVADLDLAVASDDLASPIPIDHGVTVPSVGEANRGLSGGNVVSMAFVDDVTFLAATERDLYQTTDAGNVWGRLPTPPFSPAEHITAIGATRATGPLAIVVGTTRRSSTSQLLTAST